MDNSHAKGLFEEEEKKLQKKSHKGKWFLWIGIALILFQLMSYLGSASSPQEFDGDAGAKTGYYIGRNLFGGVGLILLLIGIVRISRR
jgi:hypothetical protein